MAVGINRINTEAEILQKGPGEQGGGSLPAPYPAA